MREKLIQYVNHLFAAVPPSQPVQELHDEILQNTLDRYDDECSRGRDEESAYRHAVAGIGDIETLLSAYAPVRSHKTRYYRVTAIVLYAFCFFPVLFGELFGALGNSIGICLMFLMIATATALIITSARPASRRARQRGIAVGLYILCPTGPVFFEEAVGGAVGETIGVLVLFLFAAAATLLLVLPAKEAIPAPEGVPDVPTTTPVRSKAKRIWAPLYWILAALLFCALGNLGFSAVAWVIFPFAAALGDVIMGIVLLLRHGFGGRKLAVGLLWMAILSGYWILTCATDALAVTWLLFPIGGALNGVFSGIADLMKGDSK